MYIFNQFFMAWCCYLLMSLDSSKTYIGSSNDVQRRLSNHNRGKGAKYTRGETWIPILVIEGFKSKQSCLSFECVWKQVSKRRKQINLIGLSEKSEMALSYSVDPKYNRIMDLLILSNRTMMQDNKYRSTGVVPYKLEIAVMMEEWIKDLPWPFYVSIK